jgi:3-deoxy-D-manno-octulosonic-acid transferase
MDQMARIAYLLFLYALSPVIFLYLWLRGYKDSAYRQRWAERLGFYTDALDTHSLVIHCASVGEVIAVSPLIKKLLNKFPNQRITLTCNTPTGSEQIRKIFVQSVQQIYLPLDFSGSVGRFLNKLKPTALVIIETELWPNLIIKAKQQNIPVIVINARLSDKSLKGYQLIAPLSRAVMDAITVVASHSEADALRFKQLGISDGQCAVVGSIKFDIHLSAEVKNNAMTLLEQLKDYEFIWVAGSTHPSEHEQVIAAHQLLRTTVANSLLIIAPRHPEQFEQVALYLDQANIPFARRSKNNLKDQPILLADSMGEMLCLYAVANCAFIGGSLIERGGHNPVEAATLAKPVITGPSYYNFMHVYPQLLETQGCVQIDSSATLCKQLQTYANSPQTAKLHGENALKLVKQSSGAIDRTIDILRPHLKK